MLHRDSELYKMGGAYSTRGRDDKCYEILVGKAARKCQRGRPMRRRKNNIKIDHREIEWKDF